MNSPHIPRIEGSAGARRHFRFFDYLMAAFVAILLLSNLIGAAKLTTVWGYTFGAGILFFPISYVFGDVLTEVYGYARARKVIWAGFGAMVFATVMSWVVIHLPQNPLEPYNKIIQPGLAVKPALFWNGCLATEQNT